MPNITVDVVGLQQLERNMEDLAREYGPRNAISALRTPIRNILNPIADQIKARTPVDTGDLRDSVRIRIRTPSRRDLNGLVDKLPATTVIIGRVGWEWRRSLTNLGPRAFRTEFGSRYLPANHILRDALDQIQAATQTSFVTDLTKSIETTTQRLGKRRAKGTLRIR